MSYPLTAVAAVVAVDVVVEDDTTIDEPALVPDFDPVSAPDLCLLHFLLGFGFGKVVSVVRVDGVAGP